MSLSATRAGSRTTGMGLSPTPFLHNLRGLVPIHIPVQIQRICVPGIGDLYLGVGYCRRLKSSQHHVLCIAIRVVYGPPQAQGWGQSSPPDLNFASAIKAHGSNWGFAGRGTQKLEPPREPGTCPPMGCHLDRNHRPSHGSFEVPVALADPWSG